MPECLLRFGYPPNLLFCFRNFISSEYEAFTMSFLYEVPTKERIFFKGTKKPSQVSHALNLLCINAPV